MSLAFCHDVDKLEAGLDEAGRGCLAGPVVAAAVILDQAIPELNDSKKLSSAQRSLLATTIKAQSKAWAIGEVSPQEIDKINILQASFLAMHRALDQLSIQPDCLLIDGNRFKPYRKIAHFCMVKGDGRYQSIAAASILAKTYRDELMIQAHKDYPHYQWITNMGYPTIAHKLAIKSNGFSPIHRKSFRWHLTAKQLAFNFNDLE